MKYPRKRKARVGSPLDRYVGDLAVWWVQFVPGLLDLICCLNLSIRDTLLPRLAYGVGKVQSVVLSCIQLRVSAAVHEFDQTVIFSLDGNGKLLVF
jgi:hypothetical protein